MATPPSRPTSSLEGLILAEGIETGAQLGFLRRQQCDVGQGYLFDKPISGRELIDSLRRYPCRPQADQRL